MPTVTAPDRAEHAVADVDWNAIVQFPAGKVDGNVLKSARDEVAQFVEKNSPLGSLERHKPHLLLPAVYDLGHSPAILDAVRAFLGTDDFFQWYSVLFVKEKNTAGYIPWHYDDYFWGFDATDGCTAWVALEDVTVENGAMEFAPGTPDAARLYVQFEGNNLLVRGNNSTFEPKPNDEIKHIILKGGEFSIHSNKAWHRSGPNNSPKHRLAVAFRFITTDAVPKNFKMLKRGGVPREGRVIPNAFYVELRPARECPVGQSWQHKKSILISTFLTSFGDANRSLFQQVKDFFAMMMTARFFILFGSIASAIFGKDKKRTSKPSAFNKINDG